MHNLHLRPRGGVKYDSVSEEQNATSHPTPLPASSQKRHVLMLSIRNGWVYLSRQKHLLPMLSIGKGRFVLMLSISNGCLYLSRQRHKLPMLSIGIGRFVLMLSIGKGTPCLC